MAEKKPKRLQYRYVEGLETERTLQGLLRPILANSHRQIGMRSEPMEDDAGGEPVRRCIIDWDEFSEMLFGMMINYVPGTNRQAVEIDDTRERIQPQQVTLPKVDGHRREFVEGVVYFGLLGNHMVVVQSQGLRDRHLEEHLKWLIIKNADKLKQGEVLGLRRELTMAAKQKISEVRDVEIGHPLVVPTAHEQRTTRRGKTVNEVTKFEISDLSTSVLDQLFGTEWKKRLNGYKYDDVDSLRVTVKIEKRGGPRTPGNNPERLMTALTTQLRHSYEEDIKVHTRHGEIRGETLFLAEDRSVKCVGGIPKTGDMFIEMREWLSSKIAEGYISPE